MSVPVSMPKSCLSLSAVCKVQVSGNSRGQGLNLSPRYLLKLFPGVDILLQEIAAVIIQGSEGLGGSCGRQLQPVKLLQFHVLGAVEEFQGLQGKSQ